MRDRHAPSLPRLAPDEHGSALHLIGVFGRIIGHLRSPGQTLAT